MANFTEKYYKLDEWLEVCERHGYITEWPNAELITAHKNGVEFGHFDLVRMVGYIEP